MRTKPATFPFTVKGDSMIGACIAEGDKVVVDRALPPPGTTTSSSRSPTASTR